MFLREDILIEIFSRLPTKSVGKCRCLSKTWCTNLSASQFISQHLTTTRKGKQPKLVLERVRRRSLHVSSLPIEDVRATFSNKVELPTDSHFVVVDSCNGLVLLLTPRRHFDELILVNPITFQHVKVPVLTWKKYTSLTYGFGYDDCCDDYKIVAISYGGVTGQDRSSSTTVEVYSVKSKVWKRVNTSPQHSFYGIFLSGVFTNGAIHWGLSSYDPSRIVAFSLADEVFYDIPFPAASADDFSSSVHVFEGCLCVVDQSCMIKRDIWIMNEYGVEDSWTKFSVDGAGDIKRPLHFIGDEIALLTYSNTVIAYNMEDGTSKEMIVDDGNAACTRDVVVFFDSLVSPGTSKEMVVDDGIADCTLDGIACFDSLVSPNQAC